MAEQNFIEGFDDGFALEHWDNNTGVTAAHIDAAYGRNGKGIRLGDTPGNYLNSDFGGSSYRYSAIGFAVYVVDYGGVGRLINTNSDSYAYISIDETQQRIGYYNDLIGFVWAAANSLTPDTWHYVEVYQDVSNSGAWEIKVDGSTVAGQTGVDILKYSATNYMWRLGESVDDVYIDDMWLQASASPLTLKGDIEVVTLLPSGNGTTSDMVGSDADSTDNYLLVDNNASIPPATTEYVESKIAGDIDTYAMDDLTGTPPVLAVQTTLYAAMNNTGPKSIRPVIRSGGTDYPGTTVGLQNSVYLSSIEINETDPDTAVAWTYGGVNAMEVGQEVRDS